MQLQIYQIENPKYRKNIFDDASQITHIVANANYSNIYFIDGSVINVSYNLKRIERLGKIDQTFRRVHKSYIVNCRFIKNFSEDGDRIYLQNGVVIPVKYFNANKFLF